MKDFWRKCKRQPMKMGIVCMLIAAASAMLVGGNVLAMQDAETTSANNGYDVEKAVKEAQENGQYFFSNDFDASLDNGVYLSVLINADKGEVINRFLKDSEIGVSGVLGGAQSALSSVKYDGVEMPQLSVDFIQNNYAFNIPGKLLQGELPKSNDQVAVSQQAAEQYGWQIGNKVSFEGGMSDSYTISGIWGTEAADLNSDFAAFTDKYVDVPFIITAQGIAVGKTYTIDEIPADATIVVVDKETGEPMNLPLQNDRIDFYSEINKEILHFEKTDVNTYAIAKGSPQTHTYWTIYIDNPEHARQFYVELQDILAD